jgi:hypothetical protein
MLTQLMSSLFVEREREMCLGEYRECRRNINIKNRNTKSSNVEGLFYPFYRHVLFPRSESLIDTIPGIRGSPKTKLFKHPIARVVRFAHLSSGLPSASRVGFYVSLYLKVTYLYVRTGRYTGTLANPLLNGWRALRVQNLHT